MGHGAKQAEYLDWKACLLGNIPHARTANAKGAVFADFTPLPELGELREAVYSGTARSTSPGTTSRPHAAGPGRLVHGRRLLHSPSKGVQERTAGGTGRIEICVEAMSPGSRERLVDYLRDTHGLDVKLAVPRGAEGERACSSAPRHRRNSRSSSHRTFTRRWSTSCCRDSVASSAVEPEFAPDDITAGAGADPGYPCQAAAPIHEPLRHRGGGIAQLLRRRGDGAQQPGDHHGRQGAQVLRLRPPGCAADRDAEGRYRCRRQPHPRQGREEQDAPRHSRARNSTFCTGSGSAARAA